MRDIESNRIDLRSDTVTQPTAPMRQAMANAAVGDDVLGDDPTVQRLEAMVAEMCGKEAGLFVPSGTMSNAVALKTHTVPGDEIVTERYSHIYLYEGEDMLLCADQALLFRKESMAYLRLNSFNRQFENNVVHNRTILMETSSVSKTRRTVEEGRVMSKMFSMQLLKCHEKRTVQHTSMVLEFSMHLLPPRRLCHA